MAVKTLEWRSKLLNGGQNFWRKANLLYEKEELDKGRNFLVPVTNFFRLGGTGFGPIWSVFCVARRPEGRSGHAGGPPGELHEAVEWPVTAQLPVNESGVRVMIL
jgi:hypothetical protein